MPSNSAVDRWSRVALGCLFMATPLAFFALARFDHPAYDDYWYAVAARNGFWASQKLWYQTWNGRYLANAVQFGFPLLFDMIRAYPWIPVVGLSAFALSLWGFLRGLNRALGRPVSRLGVFAAALGLFSVYLNQMPSPCDGFYWLPAVASYSLPMITALLVLWCALAIGVNSSWAAIASIAVIAALLAFITAGSSELFLAPLGAVLLAGTAVAVKRKHPSAWVWAAALAGFSIGAAILTLAPGNAVRASLFHKSPWLACGNTILKLLTWFVLGPMGLGVTILSIPAAVKLGRSLTWTPRVTGRHVAYAAAISVVLMMLSVLPAISVGLTPPKRVLNATYLIFLLGWFATAFLAIHWYHNTKSLAPLMSPWSQKLGWALVVTGALLVGNFPRAVYDLTCVAGEFNRQMQTRYAVLKQYATSGERVAMIDPVTANPKTIYPADDKADQASSVHLSRYFGLAAPTVTIRWEMAFPCSSGDSGKQRKNAVARGG